MHWCGKYNLRILLRHVLKMVQAASPFLIICMYLPFLALQKSLRQGAFFESAVGCINTQAKFFSNCPTSGWRSNRFIHSSNICTYSIMTTTSNYYRQNILRNFSGIWNLPDDEPYSSSETNERPIYTPFSGLSPSSVECI